MDDSNFHTPDSQMMNYNQATAPSQPRDTRLMAHASYGQEQQAGGLQDLHMGDCNFTSPDTVMSERRVFERNSTSYQSQERY